jgi:hypothetical protein
MRVVRQSERCSSFQKISLRIAIISRALLYAMRKTPTADGLGVRLSRVTRPVETAAAEIPHVFPLE